MGRSASPDDLGDVVAAFARAWEERDAQALAALFTPDGEYEEVPTGRVFRGAEEIAGFLGYGFAGAPDATFEITSLVRTASGAAAEWTWSGTHTGDWPGLPASGRAFTLRGVTVLAVEEGRVRRAADYFDRATLRRQLGG